MQGSGAAGKGVHDATLARARARRDTRQSAGWFGRCKSKTKGEGRIGSTTAEPGKRLGDELYFPDFGTTASGGLGLQAAGTGTHVVGLKYGDMGSNPLWRWMTLFMDGRLGKDFKAGLAKPKALAEKH